MSKKSAKNQSNYTDEFREQIAKLYLNGKSTMEITRDYGISKTTIYNWSSKHEKSGSFRDKENRSTEETELIKLRKENKQLRMENDILKQAALILAVR